MTDPDEKARRLIRETAREVIEQYRPALRTLGKPVDEWDELVEERLREIQAQEPLPGQLTLGDEP
jgi:hypothetical protein